MSMTSQIQNQTSYLLENGICTEMSDQDLCNQIFPEVFEFLGPMIWRGHFSHICDNKISECGTMPVNYYGNLTVSHKKIFYG